MRERQEMMTEVCNDNPDKLFVFAAGDEGEDWTSFDKRPSNCLIVGWFDSGGVLGGTKGADIYMDMEVGGWPLTSQPATFFATACVSQLAQIVEYRGGEKA